MAIEGAKRKLAAILSADVKDYSRLMAEDEVETAHRLKEYRGLISMRVEEHRGRVVDTPGDNLLAEFPSALDATRCAVEIQVMLKNRNADLPADHRMEYRIGVHLGDVMVDGKRISGDGVNIASRLEKLADPGGICISATVHEQVRHKLELEYEDIGEQQVKNIPDPVHAYRIRSSRGVARERGAESRPASAKPFRRVAVALVPAIMLCVGLALVWNYVIRTEKPDGSTVVQETTAAPLAKPAIAVLPFTNMSGDPEQEYFVDGMTVEIISRLSTNSMLTVIARNSTFFYKGKRLKVKQIGEELGARYVVDGSVRRAGNSIRITAQLIDATTEGHLWSRTYDRKLENVFALQDEIAQQIVSALNVEYSAPETERVRAISTENLTAYDSMLRGMGHLSRITKEDNAKAKEMFEKAVELDPRYASSHAALGWAYLNHYQFFHGWITDPRTLDQAHDSALKAQSLDDSSAYTHRLLAEIYKVKGQYDEAIAEAERATSLNPNDPDAYLTMGAILNRVGRSEETVEHIREAMRLNPHYDMEYTGTLAFAYEKLRRYDEAIASWQESLVRNPEFEGPHFYIAQIHRRLGRYGKAIASLKKVLDRNPDDMPAYQDLAWNYLALWQTQQNEDARILDLAMEAAEQSLALNEALVLSHYALTMVHLNMKQYDRAVSEAEKTIAIAPGAGWYGLLGYVYNHIGRPEEAIALAEKALRHNPEDPGALGVLGRAYRLTGRHEDAVATVRRRFAANLYFADSFINHMELAILYSELDRMEEAEAEAAKVLELVPSFSVKVYGKRIPYKDPAQAERDMAALRKAGLK